MAKVDEDIKRELEMVAGRFGPTPVISAIVLSINGDDTIRVQLDSDLEIDDVRLKSVVKAGAKIIFEPAVGSTVLIAAIDNSEQYAVISVDEVTRFYLDTGTVEFEANTDFLIGKAGDTLGKLLGDIIDEINKVVVLYGTSPDIAALTAIKNRVNNIFR